MHTATWLALHDELEKIAGPMEDAHSDYMGMMKKHMHNPQVVARMHPTEKAAVFKHLNSPKNAGLGGKMVARAGKAVATMSKAASHAAELLGLGMLAAPSVSSLRGKEWSEKNKARMEVGGLGVLAAPSAYAAGKAGLSKLKGLASKMPKHAAPSMSAMMNMHRLADAAKSVKGVAKPMAQAATKLPSAAQNATRATSLAGHTAVGGHAWNPASAAKRALSL